MRVAIGELVHILLQVLWRNGVVCPVQRTLELRPKALNAVCMDFPTHILVYLVFDRLVGVSVACYGAVDVQLVRKDSAILFNR